MNTEKLSVLPLRTLAYRKALATQKELVAQCIETGGKENFFFPVQHPPVITIGRSADSSDMRISGEDLSRRGIELVETNRGGKITFHGPGQLVVYPIINLRSRGRDLHKYLRELEEWLIKLLAIYGITANTNPPNTGVWVGEKKMASIGIAVRRWVAYHGIALNVNTRMDFFDYFVPCGLHDVEMISMAALCQQQIELEKIASEAARTFKDHFGFG